MIIHIVFTTMDMDTLEELVINKQNDLFSIMKKMFIYCMMIISCILSSCTKGEQDSYLLSRNDLQEYFPEVLDSVGGNPTLLKNVWSLERYASHREWLEDSESCCESGCNETDLDYAQLVMMQGTDMDSTSKVYFSCINRKGLLINDKDNTKQPLEVSVFGENYNSLNLDFGTFVMTDNGVFEPEKDYKGKPQIEVGYPSRFKIKAIYFTESKLKQVDAERKSTELQKEAEDAEKAKETKSLKEKKMEFIYEGYAKYGSDGAYSGAADKISIKYDSEKNALISIGKEKDILLSAEEGEGGTITYLYQSTKLKLYLYVEVSGFDDKGAIYTSCYKEEEYHDFYYLPTNRISCFKGHGTINGRSFDFKCEKVD